MSSSSSSCASRAGQFETAWELYYAAANWQLIEFESGAGVLGCSGLRDMICGYILVKPIKIKRRVQRNCIWNRLGGGRDFT